MNRLLFCVLVSALATPAAWAKSAKAAKSKPSHESPSEPFSVSTSAPRNVADLVSHFQEIDRQLSSLSASFSQSLTMADAGMAQRVEGRLEFAKPSRLRVEHSQPQRQTFVTDGVKIWVYRVDQNQVIESTLADWKKSDPLLNNLLDFGGYSKMLETYNVAYDTASLQATLTPKGKVAQPFSLKLRLSGPSYFPMETELDVGATQVRTTLSDVRFNPKIPEARFHFVVPPGADVFENFKPPIRAQENPK